MSPIVGGGTGTPVTLPVATGEAVSPCVTRYASAIDFAGFFCVGGGYAVGVDEGAGVGHVTLTDSQVDFINLGIKANVGMRLYNVTQGTYGPVTAVTNHTLVATGVVWTFGNVYRIANLTTQERSVVEHYLDITAADIHAALASVGACDCTIPAWGLELLKKINIIEAASFHVCPCAKPNLTDEMKQKWLDWSGAQLDMIRDGKIELCGQTGSNYPAVGNIQYGHTVWSEAQMIYNHEITP